MLEVQGRTRRYGDKTVVDDLTFTVLEEACMELIAHAVEYQGGTTTKSKAA